MKDHNALLATVGNIYGSLLDDAPEAGWLDGVRDWMGAEHACLNEVGNRTRWWSCSRFSKVERVLGDRFVNEPAYSLALEQAPRMQPVRLSQFVPTGALQRTDMYQQLIRPMNGGVAAIGAWRHEGVLRALTICRSAETDDDFSDGEIAALQPLLVHVRNAVRMRARLRTTEQALVQAHAALDAVRDGVVILEAGGRVRHANVEARRILDAGDGLHLEHGRLHAGRSEDDRSLQALVNDTLKLGGALRHERGADTSVVFHGTGQAVVVPRAASRRPLYVAAVPSAGTARLLDGDANEAATLLIRDADHAGAGNIEIMVALFGLTPREAELADALRDGCALSLAAARLGITEGTARQYLKSVFAKTGVERQSELAVLLRNLARNTACRASPLVVMHHAALALRGIATRAARCNLA